MSSLKRTHDLTIPMGSLILVTGATSFIGANIVREALDAGFKVRGTVRSQQKAQDTEKIIQSEDYEVCVVADMGADGAFDEAVHGVDAIIHVASVTTMSPNPSEVVLPTVHAAVDIMRSAMKEPTVKQYVYTSSSTAAAFSQPDKRFHIGIDTWNTESEQYIDLKPPYKQELGFEVYGASKYKAEQAVWQFAKENNPQFTVNCILPNCNFGRKLSSGEATADLINQVYRGEIPDVPPQYMVNVVDDARVHLAAVLDKTVVNERIYAFDTPFNWTDIIAVLKELKPDKQFVDAPANEPRDLSTVDNKRGAELLRKWWGQDGWLGLKESVRQTVANKL